MYHKQTLQGHGTVHISTCNHM